MFDALAPAVDALDAALAAGAALRRRAAAAASAAADAGRDATIPLLARKGRASYLGERSVGHQDPGATSAALLVAAAAAALAAGRLTRDASGIVVVSHSRALADAAVALAARCCTAGRCAIEVAAGLDDGDVRHRRRRRSATAIAAADRGDGVVVLMDLGSAVLSAELALELLDDDVRERVVLCPAPLVEGLVVAAVAAAGGADRDEVAAEAAGALAGKTVPPRRARRRRRGRRRRRRPRTPASSPARSP